MEKAVVTKPTGFPLLQFSLRQILLAMVGMAAGLAIWKLPKAHWLDVPVTIVGLWLAGSMLGRALRTRRRLAGEAGLSREERTGGWLLIFGLVALAATMLGVLLLRLLVARGALSFEDERGNFRLDLLTLPYDVLLVVMIASLAIGNRAPASSRAKSRFVSSMAAAGVASGWIVAVVFALNRCCMTALVCIAILGIEMAQAPRFMPDSLDVDIGNRIQRFADFGIMGGILALVNTVLLGTTCAMKTGGKIRTLMIVLLALGMIAQGWIASWILFQGFGQLSPAIAEGLGMTSPAIVMAVAILVVVSSAMIAARFSVSLSQVAPIADALSARRFAHESWQGALVVGLLALTIYLGKTLAVYLEFRRFRAFSTFGNFNFDFLLAVLFSTPNRLVELAAIFAGFSWAWRRWRNRSLASIDVLPSVNFLRFLGITVAVGIFLLITAPILAAVGVSFWLLPSR